MDGLKAVWRRVLGLFESDTLEAEMREEMRFHIEMETQRNVEKGMSEKEARQAAVRRFGHMDKIKEIAREERSVPVVENMLRDIGFAIRQLRKSPGFTFVVMLTIALGIGATTTVFSILDGVLLRPSLYEKPEELVFVTPENMEGTSTIVGLSGTQLAELEDQSTSLAKLATYDWTFNFLLHEAGSESIEGIRASADFFKVLGIEAELGRVFTDEEISVAEHPVILISHALWQHRFGADPDILGKEIRISRMPSLTVVGVMPEGLRFLPDRAAAQEPNYDVNGYVDFWTPYRPDRTNADARNLNVLARLSKGTDLDSARSELALIAARQAQANSELEGMTLEVSAANAVLDGEIRKLVVPLFGAVCFVLLIAGANVSGLLLVRGFGRQRELAVRSALGASRLRLLWLSMTESLLLALLGGSIGALLALFGTKLLLVFAPNSIPRLDQVGVDYRVFAFALGSSLLTGLCSGFLVSRQVIKPDVNKMLKEGGRNNGQSPSQRRMLNILVSGEIALTLVLLIGATLMLRTMSQLDEVKPGYETDRILTMIVTTVEMDRQTFHQESLEKVSSLPGVKSAAFVWGLPLTGNNWRVPVQIDGRPESAQIKDDIRVPIRSVSSDYFDLMSIGVLAGRGFMDTDTSEAQGVAIVNEEMVRLYFPDENPIGRKVQLTYFGDPKLVVGIVSNLKSNSLGGEVEPEIYLPFFQATAFSKHLVIRAEVAPSSLMAQVRSTLKGVDAGVVVEKMKTMKSIRSESIAEQQFAMTLIGIFSGLALFLSIVGVYGVVSHTVLQRTQETGIRMSLGAKRGHVYGMVVREGIGMASIGVVVGLVGAMLLTSALTHLLFDVSALDPVTFISIPVAMLIVVALACSIPARRATRVDPMVALRYE